MAEGKTDDNINFSSVLIKNYSPEYFKQVNLILKDNFEFPWSEENINHTNPFSYKKVYILEDKVIGFLDCKVFLDEAEILMIAVDKKLQGKGVGKFILNNFLKDMKNYKVKKIFLEVSEDNTKAIKLYKRFGFFEYGIRKKYYKNDKNAILMKKIIS